ncbi:MAG TPA: hypothetical protein VEF76_14340 [Patescibacteria group bacterium]|nr:hypothetical protein [Patescibacteria group bacterium]
MADEPNPKKPKFGQRIKALFNGLSRRELRGVIGNTLKDLRKPKELGILLVSSVVPGGWIGYAGYRIAKYKLAHQPPANDNTAPPDAVAPKPPAPPKL